MNQILIVEDDASLAASLRDYLMQERLTVSIAPDLKTARTLKSDFDLIILDWILTDGEGIEYLRELRSKSNWTPVIFLTAKSELVDKVLALESGANDFLVKPFEPRELLARIRVLTRTNSSPDVLAARGLKLNLQSREATFELKNIEMTRKEFDLTALLLSNQNRVFTREELLNKIWGFENFPTTRTVDTHVLQIRQKTCDELIQTVRGIGYRIKSDDELTKP